MISRNIETSLLAPELRVAQWIDALGQARAPLTLAELDDGFTRSSIVFSIGVCRGKY